MSSKITYQDQQNSKLDAEQEAVIKSRYENADPALYMQGIFEKSAENYYSKQGYSGADLNEKINNLDYCNHNGSVIYGAAMASVFVHLRDGKDEERAV